MNEDPFKASPTGPNSYNSETRTGSRRLWIVGLLIAELYWHFQLYAWVSPPPNKWDMGGVSVAIQFAIFVGLLTTTFLLLCMFQGIRAGRTGLIAISLSAAVLGVFIVLNRKATTLMSSAFVHELIYIVFNLGVAALLLCMTPYRLAEKNTE